MKIEVIIGDKQWVHESEGDITHAISESGVLTIYDHVSRPSLGQHYLNLKKVFSVWDELEYVR